MKGYKTIDSAPHDGTKVIAKVKGHDETVAWFEDGEWVCEDLLELRRQEDESRAHFTTPFQRRSPGRYYDYKPTHWKDTL
ncbi:MAG: hypothetical protein ACXWYM_00085 [Candidatus Binatia bacterium]